MKTSQYIVLNKCFLNICRNVLVLAISLAMLPGHAAAIDIEDVQIKTDLTINTEQCRLRNYAIEFDVMRDNSNIGRASRELIQDSKGLDASLVTALTASKIFMEFIQNERSLLPEYDARGFHSSEYSKMVKKPFKSTVENTFLVNLDTSANTADLLDPLSVYDHLRELVCSGLREDVIFKVQEDAEIANYYFKYRGEQTIALPKHTAETLLFVRTRKTSTRETSIWFDKNKYFIPVKIEQKKDGDTQALLLATTIGVNSSK